MNLSIARRKHILDIKSKVSYIEFVVLLASLMALNSLAIDVMLPALDQISYSLHAKHANDPHYIIFMYMLGFGLSQIIFGFISDKYGRKKPLIYGLIVYGIASLLCNIVPNFSDLLFLRLLQGGGAAASNVLTISIVRDVYSGKKMASTFSLIFLVFIMVPVIAPATGQVLLFFGDWHIIFSFMTFASLLTIIWVIIRLPETLFETHQLDIKSLLHRIKIILSDREAVYYTLASSCLFGGLYAVLNTAKQIYVDIFKLGKWFSLAFASIAIAQAIASILNSRLVHTIGIRTTSHSILIIYIIAAFFMSMITWLHGGYIFFYSFMFLLFIIMFAYGSIGANFNALAMEHLGNIAGAAASIIGFARITISALLGLLIAQQFNGTVEPTAFGFLGLGIAALLFVLYAEKGKLFD